jgi:hypothetical protein
MTRPVHTGWIAAGLIAVLSGCVYYNAMWSAERHANDARRFEARGQDAEARSQWAQAAVKAESVVARHPRSRWADDALVLQAEALSRSGSCVEAAVPIAKARDTVHELSLRERLGLAAAHCALASERPVQAEESLVEALTSRDERRRSRAELLAGQAAAQRRDYEAAVAHFRRSGERAALPERARALLAAGRAADASAVLDTVARASMRETDRAQLFGSLASVGDVATASTALDRHLARAKLPFAEQAHLLIADGDRHLAAEHYDAAAARYRQAAAVAPGTPDAGIAQVREQRVAIARAQSREALTPIIEELTRLGRSEGSGGIASARTLLELVTQVAAPAETPGERFRLAEVARDSLDAPRLAGRLLLDAAAADTASLYAPKALLAALALLPDARDSIVRELDTRYRASPYTRAFRGEASIAYAAAEDSLARELGVEIAHEAPATGAHVPGPRTGPRGPTIDEPAASPLARPRPARTPRPGDRSTPVRQRPSQADRP